MIKIVHLFKDYYFGISFIGIIAFIVQELPYIVMPLIKPSSNPIMNMQNEISWIGKTQAFLGILTMIMLILVVRENYTFFSISTQKEKVFFSMTILMIVINSAG